MPEMAWFALYVSYTLLFLLLTAFDLFYGTTLLVFPCSMWDKNYQEAFKELKQQLTNTPVLYHYQLELKTYLETDASDGVVAGVLT